MLKRPVSVLVVIITETGDAAIMQRADDDQFWQSVTGSVESGEDIESAAIRELAEETGLTPKMGRWINMNHSVCYTIRPQWRHRYPSGVVTNTEHWFALVLPKTVPLKLAPLEHLDYRWLTASQAQSQCSSASNAKAIQRLLDSM
ncbi:dihydroneopterin triphosphate diphosphatase [Echinimonas agarilytica]|uniref:Dihydroneopterin triphosphate diphosphatase n=1 Tax=Echinimonas agarilytica TaxID=1215918 RepID=A0AA42B7B0_9GAMM|nr:dihydroneopterin triphosphate diphosphatase [Echinimonas agarilytica]MCM2679690.1 dihydroneopterin triphosphate diphosphatase [Echinimonas agarilytica]